MRKDVPHRSGSRIEQLLGTFFLGAYSARILRIMREFRAGFKLLRKYDKTVSIFGSARNNFDESLYEEATQLAGRLSEYGFTIITGGGPGFMEAANRGAYEANGTSVGLNIVLPQEQFENKYLTESVSFRYFFTRKVMLAFASQFYIFFPGGFGTLDEFFEILTLVQTKKIDPVPIILVSRDYWEPLLDYIRTTIYEKNKAINQEDLDLYHLVDNADEAFDLIHKMVVEKE